MIRVFVAVALSSSCAAMIDDPAPGFFTTIEESRRLVCEPTSLEALRDVHPGLIEDAKPRGEFAERGAVTCAEVVLGEGERGPRDRAVLDTLEATATAIARQVAAKQTGGSKETWLVESHYPSAAVAAKISFAAKTALINNGLDVTDRQPTLAVGDIDVISRMHAIEAYAVACQRYFANGKLRDTDAVLGLLVLDSRETTLHAGTCRNGRWTWLQ